MSRDHILFDLPSVEGWAFISWARENDGLSALERESTGYIGQELDGTL